MSHDDPFARPASTHREAAPRPTTAPDLTVPMGGSPGVGTALAGLGAVAVQDPAPASAPAPAPAAAPAADAVLDESAGAESKAKTKSASSGAAPRSSSMASGGRPVEAPPSAPHAPLWPGPANPEEAYVPSEFDCSDLAEVNRQMNRARARLFRVSASLKDAQRGLVDASMAYERQMRRELVTLSGGTEASRRAMAEIRCEHLENAVVVAKQVEQEWKKRAMDVRDDLRAIENISHNVRAQMDVR